jgi:HEAT repeat protein
MGSGLRPTSLEAWRTVAHAIFSLASFANHPPASSRLNVLSSEAAALTTTICDNLRQERDPEVLYWATSALGEIRDIRASDVLCGLLESDVKYERYSLRGAAVDALGKIADKSAWDSLSRVAWTASLSEGQVGDMDIPNGDGLKAVMALRRIDFDQAVSEIEQSLDSEEARRRTRAVEIAEAISTYRTTTVPKDVREAGDRFWSAINPDEIASYKAKLIMCVRQHR